MLELELAIKQWVREVEEEAIVQIENGETPQEAGKIAEILVKERRQCKHADKSGG